MSDMVSAVVLRAIATVKPGPPERDPTRLVPPGIEDLSIGMTVDERSSRSTLGHDRRV
jgi:hypothetical protein